MHASYLQRSCSSLLWQTSITRKTSKKGTQTILTVRTRDLVFPQAGLEALQRPCWILVLQTKVMRDHFLLKRQLKEAWQRKCQQSQRDGYLFPFFFPQEGPFMLWSEIFTLMKTSKTRSSQQWNQKIGPCYTTSSGTHLVLAAGWSCMVRTGLPSRLRGSRQRSVFLVEGGH